MSLDIQIINCLKTIIDPLSNKDILSEGMVQGLEVTSLGVVSFILEVSSEHMTEGMKLKEKAEFLLRKIPEISAIKIVLTAQRKSNPAIQQKEGIPGIKYIIAIASGKGGVGKSTTAVNLAAALQTMGLRVGILDADIYGPSLPRLLGINEKPTSDDGKTMNPIEVHSLKCMSMGFLVEENMPTIWRGPMVQKAFHQMLYQVKWGNLDVLVIDLPPGTGDVQLTLAQSVLVSGAIIVSTPQDLALVDARKGVEMFLKVGVPVLGFVENMSYFTCPHCKERSDIFEHGGVHLEAKKLGVPLLAEIPLHMAIREASEKGVPLVIQNPNSSEAKTYAWLAEKVWEILGKSGKE